MKRIGGMVKSESWNVGIGSKKKKKQQQLQQLKFRCSSLFASICLTPKHQICLLYCTSCLFPPDCERLCVSCEWCSMYCTSSQSHRANFRRACQWCHKINQSKFCISREPPCYPYSSLGARSGRYACSNIHIWERNKSFYLVINLSHSGTTCTWDSAR